jgi:hypothetical protein
MCKNEGFRIISKVFSSTRNLRAKSTEENSYYNKMQTGQKIEADPKM